MLNLPRQESGKINVAKIGTLGVVSTAGLTVNFPLLRLVRYTRSG